MSGIHQFSGSFSHSGSAPATFQSGITSENAITGILLGDGSQLTNLNFSSVQLFFGSASGTPPTFGEWITGSGGRHEILLSTSASGAIFNHFTFLKLSENGWNEVSDYDGTQNGLASTNTITEELGTGIHQYLLLAMSTASKQTITAGTTVIINPE